MSNFNWPVINSSSGPIQYLLDGNVETVSQDTTVPANSTPLPVINLDANGVPEDFATEAKQDVQITELQSINTELDAQTAELIDINAELDAQTTLISGLATEATLADVLADTTAIAAVDFATETTLQSVDAELVTLNAVDFATQTTLAAVLADTTTIAAVDFATQTTLAAAAADLALLEAKDFATQTTLAAVLADTTAIAAVDFATETTLQSVDAELVTLNAVDFATETTLASIDAELVALNAVDFATQTTLAAVLADTTDIETAVESINTKLPAALGAQVSTASLSVVLASDQVAVPMSLRNTYRSKGRINYESTAVNTSLYVTLVADVGATAITEVEVFDSSGETLVLAVGAAAAEVDMNYIMPGGNGRILVSIPANARLSVKAVTATASVGYININCYG